jgi:tetratricopeptide (TPR) repeat protein
MYLRTPKRYRKSGRGRRSIRWRWVPLWIIAPILIFIGVGIYQNSDLFREDAENAFYDLIGGAEDLIDSAAGEDVLTPTPDPANDLLDADDAWGRGDIESAVEMYEEIVSLAPNNVLVHYRLALGLLMQNNLGEALSAAENAITAQPYSADAWSIRAMVLNRLDRPGEAIASLSHALDLVPESRLETEPMMAVSRARALAFLAESYLEVGQADRALDTVEEAIELNPNGFEAYQIRGRIYQVGEGYYLFDLALADFETAYDLAPNMIYVGIWLARLEQAHRQNYDVAIELYQDIIDLNPKNTLALYDLADYYFRVEGNLPEATKYLDQCIVADPNDDSCHWLLGRVLIWQGNVATSQSAFQTAYDLNPENGYRVYWLAESYIQMGMCPQAMSYLQSGYQAALDDDDEGLIIAFESSLEECRAPVIPEATPEVEGATS